MIFTQPSNVLTLFHPGKQATNIVTTASGQLTGQGHSRGVGGCEDDERNPLLSCEFDLPPTGTSPSQGQLVAVENDVARPSKSNDRLVARV